MVRPLLLLLVTRSKADHSKPKILHAMLKSDKKVNIPDMPHSLYNANKCVFADPVVYLTGINVCVAKSN